MISEFSIVTFFVTMPLVFGGATWFYKEFDQERCAYNSFVGARNEMIITHREVKFPVSIGRQHEVVSLAPLESLDQASSGLGLSDLGKEASQLSADASRLLHRLQALPSIKPSTTLKPGQDPKLP